MSAIIDTYKKLVESDFYKEYLQAEKCTYEDDKRVWRQIYQNILLNNEVLAEALEEMELVLDKSNWTMDADIIISYVIKTIKRFTAQSDPGTPLLEMFDNENEWQFATTLLQKAIEGHAQYEQLINSHLKGWDADRIAYMDRIIIETALAEILEFEEIALTVSLNEYIELAKTFSSDKSYMFINGILTEILRDLKHDGTFFKVLAMK
jgi:N utilization substance protein B